MPSVSNQDFVKGIDLTGVTSVSDAQLMQLIDAGTTASDKGIVIKILSTDTIPNAAVTTKWKRNILNIENVTTKVVVSYIWCDSLATSDPTYYKWVPINQAYIQGLITTAMAVALSDYLITHQITTAQIATTLSMPSLVLECYSIISGM